MRRGTAARLLIAALAAPFPLRGQAWNDPRALDLVRRATDRRAQQLSDSGLLDYRATAHGYVTFLAQLGEGLRTPPKVVKADELALEVFWRAPNLSKQRIVGRRDTTLLPTDIQYHRDHLGIVQNNFPAIIRIGDGDEVRDVPHPLSEVGLREYEFALNDSLSILIPGRTIDVYEVKVRPVDDQQPRFAGAVYVERATAQVVRMAFGFTRPAYLDKQLEDVFVVLENGLVGSRFWLPRRQEIEIRRRVQWMDYPARGIIRGRWDIGEYSLNVETPRGVFTGPEIVESPPTILRTYPWTGRIVDSLPPESKLPTPGEIRRVQEEARTLVREQALAGPRGALSARGASDFLRFDRNSGLSLGGGLTARLGRGLVLDAQGRYGLADGRLRHGIDLGWRTTRGSGLKVWFENDTREAGDVEERSGVVNSLAAQEFGSDYSDRYGALARGISATIVSGAARWTFDAAIEEDRMLSVSGSPFSGTFQPAFNADYWTHASWVALRVDRSLSSGPFGFEWSGGAALKSSVVHPPGLALVCPVAPPDCYAKGRVHRATIRLELERPFGDATFASGSLAAAASGDNFLRAQDLVLIGGPVSAPGFGYHELVGDRAVAQSIELRVPVPFPRLGLGRFGTTPNRASLAPHWSVVGLRGVPDSTGILRAVGVATGPDPFRLRPTGWYHSAGIALVTFFDLLRVDVSRELPSGRWMFSVDVTRAFWPIL